MALHLNLYQEIHRQAERERRDPFKLAMLAGVVILILMTLWYFHRYSAVSALQQQCAALQNTWKTVEPEIKKAQANKEAFLTQQKNNQVLLDYLRGRFYWAPVLAHIATLTPPTVQLADISGELQEKDGKKEISLKFKGTVAGEQSRSSAEQFRRAFQEKFSSVYGSTSALFDANTLEEQAETVDLNGKNLGTAAFCIRVQFSVAAPTPTPALPLAPKKTSR
jgi:Tfp pilus assembly protein PilN